MTGGESARARLTWVHLARLLVPSPPPPGADTESERNGRGGFKAGSGTRSLSREARSDLHPELRLRKPCPHSSLIVTQKLHRYSGPDDDTEQLVLVCEKRISSPGPRVSPPWLISPWGNYVTQSGLVPFSQ